MNTPDICRIWKRNDKWNNKQIDTTNVVQQASGNGATASLYNGARISDSPERIAVAYEKSEKYRLCL